MPRTKEERKAYQKAYYQKNKQKIIDRTKEHYENNKEHRKQKIKEWQDLNREKVLGYEQLPKTKKKSRIYAWKKQGIIVDNNDYDKFYDSVLSTTNCQKCNKELTEDRRTTHSTRCLDHDHNVNDRPNVRMICCHACNSNDKLTNTSGEPNISYDKRDKRWCFQKIIQGKTYSKSGFKTKEEAINYKYKFLASPIFG